MERSSEPCDEEEDEEKESEVDRLVSASEESASLCVCASLLIDTKQFVNR